MRVAYIVTTSAANNQENKMCYVTNAFSLRPMAVMMARTLEIEAQEIESKLNVAPYFSDLGAELELRAFEARKAADCAHIKAFGF